MHVKIPNDLMEDVIAAFDGDTEKAERWFDTVNPLFGGVRPATIILRGHPHLIRKFIHEATECN